MEEQPLELVWEQMLFMDDYSIGEYCKINRNASSKLL